jgi:hypothetical protein
MPAEPPDELRTAEAAAPPIVPLIVRGEVIESDLHRFPLRGGGGGQAGGAAQFFLAPDPSLYVARLPTTAASLRDLHATPIDEIIDLVADLGAALDFDHNSHLQSAFAMSLRASGLPRTILESAYAGLPRLLDRDKIERFVDTQIGRDYLEGWVKTDLGSGRTLSVRAFGARSVHIIAGNTPAVAFLTILRAAVTRSDAIIKLPSNDPLTAVAMLRTLIDIAPDHPVTKHLCAAYWKGGDRSVESRLYQPRHVEKIVAWGGLSSITHVAEYLQPGMDLVTLDPKTSCSIIGPEALRTERSILEVAERAALDIGSYNQEACANARVLYVVCDASDPDQLERLDRLGRRIMAGLVQLPEEISTSAKTVDRELQDELGGIALQDDFYRVFRTDDPADGAVVVSRFDEPVEFADRLSGRTANLVPVPSVEEAIKRVSAAQQTIGVYPDSLKAEIRDALALQGAQHVMSLGDVMSLGVSGPQDGLETERRMLKWVRDMSGEPMPARLEYSVRAETPSLDHYRRDWRPAPGLGLAGMWLPGVVSDASGQLYLGMRSADDMAPGMVRSVIPTCGFRRVVRSMAGDPPHLFAEYAEIDFYEPYECIETRGRVQTIYASGRIERDQNGCHWYDARDRWELHARTISDVFLVHVPKQDGVDCDVYYRHELMKATGHIEGVPVEGYLHQDYSYAPEGRVYTETAIPRKLQGMWVSWLHEFDDGELGGGCFWQGKAGVSFGPGYQVKNGVTSLHDDVVADPSFDADNNLCGLDVSIGDDRYQFELDRKGSPIHYFGLLVGSSLRKRPRKSWCWIECTGGLLAPEVLDDALKPFRIVRGR